VVNVCSGEINDFGVCSGRTNGKWGDSQRVAAGLIARRNLGTSDLLGWTIRWAGLAAFNG
jgi:hypothetical protein